MGDEPYADRGLAESQLEGWVLAFAEAVAGPVVGIAVPGRGGVLWQPGEVRLIGPVSVEFERAIEALLDDVDLGSRSAVLGALLSLGGARLVVDRSGLVQ
jgi:hypothetical protein